MSGSLEKLTIISYSDDTYETSVGDPYVALINPEQIAEESKTEFTDVSPGGGASSTKKFQLKPSPKLSLKFLFDGTGIIDTTNSTVDSDALEAGAPATGKSTGGTVEEQIAAFKKVTADYQGDIHQPGFVKIFWGGVIFKGRMSSLKITYTLFKPDGTPLRAVGDAVFEESLDHLTKNNAQNNSSPDLTHVRTVTKGDTLPLMCHRIYKDSSLYLKVAKVNRLSDYRSLEVGTKLFFPPIKNEA